MADITVTTAPKHNGWTFGVQVAETNGQTRHSVTLTRGEFERLTEGKDTTPEALVRRSFEFLLEHEPKHLILRQFALQDISLHFPEYSKEIRTRL